LGEPHVATLDASLPEGEVFGELVFELSRREPFAAWAKT
jgi:hypothetical protein